MKTILISALLTITTLGLVGQSLYKKSLKELSKGDTIQSLKLLNDLLLDDPQNIKGYFLRAHIYINTNQIEKAIGDLDKILGIEPTNIDALAKHAFAKSIEGDFDAAIEDTDKRIKLESANPKTYYERGYYYLMTDKWEKAIRDYDQAILLDTLYKEAYAARGLAKLNALKMKWKVDPDGIEKASACQDLRKAQQLGHDSADMLRTYCEQ